MEPAQSPKSFAKVLVFVKSETEKPEEEGTKKLCKDVSAKEVDELVSKLKSQLRIDNVKTLEYFDEDFKSWVEVNTLDDVPSTPKLRVITPASSSSTPTSPAPVPVLASNPREPTPVPVPVATSREPTTPVLDRNSDLSGSASTFTANNAGSTAQQRNKPEWSATPTNRERERPSLVGSAKVDNTPPKTPVTKVDTSAFSSPSAFNSYTPALLSSTEPWKWENSFLQKPGWVNKGNSGATFKAFSVKEGGKVLDSDELKKVEYLFASCLKGSLFEIEKVHAIQNQSLESQFDLTAQKIKTRIEQSPQIFNQKTYKQDANADWREAVIDTFNQYSEMFAHNLNNGVKIIPVAHGTQENSAWSVCQTGFATLGWTDSGYFGKGLYFSQHAEYSALCYGDNTAKPDEFTLLICWVAVGNPYPCIENPFEKDSLKGGGAKSGYDSHFTVVKAHNDDPNTKVYVPCEPNLFQIKRTFNEFVIFQEGQVLPRYILTVKKKSVNAQQMLEAMKKKEEEPMKAMMRTFIDIYEQPVERIIADKAKWQNKDLIRLVLELLDKYLENPEMQFLLCSTLWLLSRVQENRAQLLSAGAIPLASAALKKYQEQPRLVERACCVLANLMLESTGPKILAQLSGLQPLISTLSALMNHAYVVEQACKVLRHVAAQDDMQVKLAELGCIVAAVNALNIHKLHAGVQKEASALLWNISNNEGNRVICAQKGAIHALLDAIQNNKRVPEVQEYICGALWNIAVPAQNQVLMADLGGIPLLLNTLKNHKKHEGACHRALGALWNLAVNDKNQITIAQAGGIPDIINAMNEHKNSAKVSEFGCACLWNLGVNDQNKIAIVQHQGLTAVVCAMGTFRDTESVQQKAMNALWNMTAKTLPVANLPFGYAVNLDKEGRLYFVDHQTKKTTYDCPHPTQCSPMNVITFAQVGALNALLIAMYKFPNNVTIQEGGCAVIRNVCNQDRNLSITVCSLMGIQTIIKAATIHKTNAKVVDMASRALHNCGLLDQNKPYLAQQGAITLLASHLRDWASNSSICAATCGALWTLALNDSNKTMMFQAGIVPLVVAMLKTHVAVEVCQEKGLGVFWNLTVPANVRHEISRQGGVVLALQAMANFPNSESVNEPAVGCLWNWHLDSENLATIKKNKKLLMTARSNFPSNEKIQEKTNKMLPKL